MRTTRLHPNVRVSHPSPNVSSRGGVTPRLIVIHATAGHNRPGISDLQALGGWFGQARSRVSSHVATDNEGNSARFVNDTDKAWHCMAFNRLSLGIEQVAPGDGTEITDAMYLETARWVAQWSRRYNIPIRVGARNGGTLTRTGVLRHSDLGSPGGGHADPGRYDEHKMLSYARAIRHHL